MLKRLLVSGALLGEALVFLIIWESTGRLFPAISAVFCAAIAMPILVGLARERL